VVRNGIQKLLELSPLVECLVAAYLRARQAALDDSDLLVRATAFAGWHLFDRTLAVASQSGRLSPVHLAAAGVGRQALLTPERYAATVGLVSRP
jgi:hypothetical protein